MAVSPTANIEITAFKWVPPFAEGFVRDLRPRWACEEIGLDYAERLIDAMTPRPESYLREQPWGQVPVLKSGDIEIFESGAILLHLGEMDQRLMPVDPGQRARTISWLFAAFNTIEPGFFELATVDIFARDETWAKLRRPGLLQFIGGRLDGLDHALGDRQWLGTNFSVADIAMSTVLREARDTDLVSSRPRLADYLQRCVDRPAFERALASQLAAFKRNQPQG